MNAQRQQFQKKVATHMSGTGASATQTSGAGDAQHEGMARIEHHPDGTHTIHHADGEKSGPHPNMAHAMMHMMAKHHGGEHGHIEPHAGGGATTHHVDMSGEVQGPHDHESEEDAYNHMRGNIGEGAGMEGERPMGGGTDAEDSSFE